MCGFPSGLIEVALTAAPCRDIGIIVHREIIYVRQLQTGALPAGDKRRKTTSVVVKMIKANKEVHGFEGHIGLVVGHPMLLKHQIAEEQLLTAAAVPPCSFQAFCLTLKGDMTLDQAREAWKNTQDNKEDEPRATPAATVSVVTDIQSDTQSLSSVSVSLLSSVASPPVASPPSPRRTALAPPKSSEPPRNSSKRKVSPRCITIGTDAARKWGCKANHDLHTMLQWERDSFDHLRLHDNHAEFCCCCGKSFRNGHMKLKDRNPEEYVQFPRGRNKIFGCKFSREPNHRCKFVLCVPCHGLLVTELSDHCKKKGEMSPSRASKKSRLGKPYPK